MNQKQKSKKTKQKTPASPTRAWLTILIIFLSLIIIFLAASAGFFYYFQNKTLPRISLGNTTFTGLTQVETQTKVAELITTFEQQGLTFSYQEITATIYPTVLLSNDLDSTLEIISFNKDDLAKKIYQIGHTGNWQKKFKEIWQTLLMGYKLEADYTFKQATFIEELEKYFSNFETKALNADIVYNSETDTWSTSPEKNGTEFAYSSYIKEIKENLKYIQSAKFTLQLTTKYPEIAEETAQNFISQIDQVLELAPLKLTYEDQNFEVGIDLLKTWLSVKKDAQQTYLGIDRKKSTKVMNEVAGQIYVETQNGKFTLENDRVTEFQGSQSGKALNIENSLNSIDQALQDKSAIAELIVDVTEPALPIGDLNNLGIEELIGSGESNFYGSSTTRIHNVQIGANMLNGLLIAPDEEFTTIGNLTPITRANGYLSELVIKGSETIPELGGGLCQIGTTMFRVAINSGLPITQRRPHSYQVSYYNPVGFDATIYDPNPDMRFTNDTGHYILIQTIIDIPNRYLKFEFWGTSDNRQIEKTSFRYWDRTSPPATIYHETTDLAPGEKHCTENAIPGIKAAFDRTVTYADGNIMQNTFESAYKAWPAVCQLGIVPEEEPEPEAEPTTNLNTNTNQ